AVGGGFHFFAARTEDALFFLGALGRLPGHRFHGGGNGGATEIPVHLAVGDERFVAVLEQHAGCPRTVGVRLREADVRVTVAEAVNLFVEFSGLRDERDGRLIVGQQVCVLQRHFTERLGEHVELGCLHGGGEDRQRRVGEVIGCELHFVVADEVHHCVEQRRVGLRDHPHGVNG